MKVLINYGPEDKPYVGIVGGLLKKRGIEAVATPKTYTMTQLLQIAKAPEVGASAILLANEETLQNLVKVSTRKKATLNSFRGSRLNFSAPVIVTNPFTHIRTVNHGKWLLEKDLDKFAHIDKKPIQLAFTVLETPELFRYAEKVLASCLLLSIDIETTTEGRITCVSFTGLLDANTTVTYVLPLIDFGQNHWTEPRLYTQAIQCMQNICANNVPKMMFNNTYDAQYLIRYHAYPNNLVIDVMGMAHSQYSELPKTLDFTSSWLLWDYYQWKHEADNARDEKDIRAYWGYCARDSWNTLRAFLYLSAQFPTYAVKNYQLAYKLTFPCIYCAFEGILIDNVERLKKLEGAKEELEKRRKDLQVMSANPNFNPSSPKQTATFIYDILGAKRLKGDSTDEKVLARVAEQHPLLARVCDDIKVFREKVKEIGTYYEFEQWNNRLVYSLGPFATETSRFSSRSGNWFTVGADGKITSYGTQIQNIPEYAKSMVIADSGYTLFEADNNKSEARCVAHQANCQKLIDVLDDTEHDFYKVLAGIFFGIKYEDVTKELRNTVIKRIIHGTNYMMGIDTFIQTAGVKQILLGAALLGMPVTDLKKFVGYLLGIYHERFPEVRIGYLETKREVMRTSKLVSPMGHTRYFFGNIIENHKVFRSAVAHKPQNLSVTILNKGFWKVYKLVVDSDGKLRLKAQIHDSNMGQIKDEYVDYYKPLILEAMDNPVQMPTGKTLSIPVDFATGKTWLEVKGG